MSTKPTYKTNPGAAPQDPQDHQDSLDQPHFNLGAEGSDSSYGIGNDQSMVLSQTRDETATEHSDSVSSNTTGCTEASNSEPNKSSEAEQIPFPSTLDVSSNLGKTHPPNKVDEREEGKVTPPNNKGKTHLPSSTGTTRDLAAGTSTAGSAGRSKTGKTPDPTQEPESQTGSQIPPSGKVRLSTEAIYPGAAIEQADPNPTQSDPAPGLIPPTPTNPRGCNPPSILKPPRLILRTPNPHDTSTPKTGDNRKGTHRRIIIQGTQKTH